LLFATTRCFVYFLRGRAVAHATISYLFDAAFTRRHDAAAAGETVIRLIVLFNHHRYAMRHAMMFVATRDAMRGSANAPARMRLSARVAMRQLRYYAMLLMLAMLFLSF